MAATPYELPRHECVELAEAQTVGRLCIIDHGYPLAFPVNYRVTRKEGGAVSIVVRVSPSAAIGKYEGPASFEVDQIDLDNVRAWSVMVRGAFRNSRIDDQLPDTNPLVTEGRYQWKVLDVTAVSGRRFAGTADNGCFSVDWQPSRN
jgi:hypothetical protein